MRWFASDSLARTSDARGSGTKAKALARALLWKDVGAKHAYVLFLGDDGAGDDDFDAVGGGGVGRVGGGGSGSGGGGGGGGGGR